MQLKDGDSMRDLEVAKFNSESILSRREFVTSIENDIIAVVGYFARRFFSN